MFLVFEKVFFTGQLWNQKKNVLSNRLWPTKDEWKLQYARTEKGEDQDLDIFYITNTSTGTVLTLKSTRKDSTVIEEPFDSENKRQMWTKGMLNGDEYFTIASYLSNLVLSAVSVGRLELEGET